MGDVEHEAADQIRRLMCEDERFSGVSGVTAFRRADENRGWTDAGYFSFERDGHRYFVTVESAERKPEPRLEGHADCGICKRRVAVIH